MTGTPSSPEGEGFQPAPPESWGQPGTENQAGGQWGQPGSQYGQAGGQWDQPGGPQPGGQWVQSGGPQPFGYDPGAFKPRRRWRAVVIGAVAVVIAAGVIAGQHFITNQPKGSVKLPGALLGLSKATGASAQGLANEIKKNESSGAAGKLVNLVAGVYGTPTGSWLVVSGGGDCGSCRPKSASVVREALITSGLLNARSFPPGAKGGVLICGSRAPQGVTLIFCNWADSQTGGDVVFGGPSASGLADAAAKTNQIRAAVEH